MKNLNYKIVVFDLDETMGCFTELSIFISSLEKELNKKISIDDFFKLLDIFPEFLRPKILQIFEYLKDKKEKNNKIKVMIYTNNQGPRDWVIRIKKYFENKLNYKLFDQIIAAFKVKGEQIELCRTTHNKTIDDFLRCTQLPKETKICFLDDQYHEEMESDNVFYINVKPYHYNLSFEEMSDRYYNNFVVDKDKEGFINNIVNNMKHSNFKPIKKNDDEQKIDEIVSKRIISYLIEFFKKNAMNKTKKYLKNKNKRKTKKV